MKEGEFYCETCGWRSHASVTREHLLWCYPEGKCLNCAAIGVEAYFTHEIEEPQARLI